MPLHIWYTTVLRNCTAIPRRAHHLCNCNHPASRQRRRSDPENSASLHTARWGHSNHLGRAYRDRRTRDRRIGVIRSSATHRSFLWPLPCCHGSSLRSSTSTSTSARAKRRLASSRAVRIRLPTESILATTVPKIRAKTRLPGCTTTSPVQ
jgi:hypothetical protein